MRDCVSILKDDLIANKRRSMAYSVNKDNKIHRWSSLAENEGEDDILPIDDFNFLVFAKCNGLVFAEFETVYLKTSIGERFRIYSNQTCTNSVIEYYASDWKTIWDIGEYRQQLEQTREEEREKEFLKEVAITIE